MKSDSSRLSRRSFLRRSGGAVAALGFPAIVPSTVFGADAPSNRVVMGAIGVGGMGSGNLRAFLGHGGVQVVSVCDVDSNNLNRAAGAVNGRYKNEDCKRYKDFRELLAKDDLDAVSIALPDHWHAVICSAAARAGKDIYGEKPLARSIREGRAICDAVHRYGRVWQTGSWQRSRGHFHQACELVRNGRLGKLQRVEVGLPTGKSIGRQAPKDPPPNLDWDFWLGPAPWRPFCDGIIHFNWRWVTDYSGGQLTDWAGHHIDIAHWGLGKDQDGPVKISDATAEYPADGLYNVPMQYSFRCTYADGLIMDVANNKKFPMGAKWYGDKGWIHVWRGGLRAEPASLLQEKVGPGEVRLYKSNNHHGNFIDCVKSRQITITPVETAHRSISVGLLGEIAMTTGRTIHWDPVREEIAGDPGASALLGRPYRQPWHL